MSIIQNALKRKEEEEDGAKPMLNLKKPVEAASKSSPDSTPALSLTAKTPSNEKQRVAPQQPASAVKPPLISLKASAAEGKKTPLISSQKPAVDEKAADEKAPLLALQTPVAKDKAPLITLQAPAAKEKAPLITHQEPAVDEKASLISLQAPSRAEAPLVAPQSLKPPSVSRKYEPAASPTPAPRLFGGNAQPRATPPPYTPPTGSDTSSLFTIVFSLVFILGALGAAGFLIYKGVASKTAESGDSSQRTEQVAEQNQNTTQPKKSWFGFMKKGKSGDANEPNEERKPISQMTPKEIANKEMKSKPGKTLQQAAREIQKAVERNTLEDSPSSISKKLSARQIGEETATKNVLSLFDQSNDGNAHKGPWPAIHLQGVMAANTVNELGSAMINNKLVEEGMEVNGVLISKILPDKVVLKYKGATRVLLVGEKVQ